MCVLRVTGKQFDPESSLAVSGLTADKVFHAGEPRFSSRPKGERFAESGFRIEVSDASWASLSGQVSDAIRFLREHERDLARLRSTPGIDDMRLDFPVDLRIDRKNVMAQFDYFPPELVTRAGALGFGIELSVYPRDLEQLAKPLRPRRTGRRRGSCRLLGCPRRCCRAAACLSLLSARDCDESCANASPRACDYLCVRSSLSAINVSSRFVSPWSSINSRFSAAVWAHASL